MDIKKEPEGVIEIGNQDERQEEDDRKLPSWMLTSDETRAQNEEGPESPPPSEHEKESVVTPPGAPVLQ